MSTYRGSPGSSKKKRCAPMSNVVSVSPPSNGTLDSPSCSVQPIITLDSTEQAARMVALQSFQFRHRLGNSPLLSFPMVREITKRLLDQRRFDQVLFDSGLPGSSPKKADESSGKDILDSLDQYESRRAWLRLTRIDEVAPELKDIVSQFCQDLSELHKRDIRREVIKTFTTLFVSSPGAVTSYHLDHTWNYLLQISGSKTVHLFDPNDPRVLTQVDKENWYGQRTGTSRKQGVSGISYDLGPGDGVHHPVNAPHWVQNGSDVSISLSLGLCLLQSTRDGQVYQVNYLLRRLGLKPRPPRSSAWRDSLKLSFIRMVSDRSPSSFDDVLFSGMYRLRRIMRMAGLSRFATVKRVELT